MSISVLESADEQQQAEHTPSEPTLSTDEIFHILQNDRRRNVLRFLQGAEEPVQMRDIAEQVAAWEHDTTVRALSSDQRQRVYIPLYQSHLPKLDNAGVINYQQSRGIVERTPLADLFDPYLNAGAEHAEFEQDDDRSDEHWDDYYIGISTLGTIMLVGAILELPVVATISGFTVALIILLMFTLLTVGRYYRK